jgi:hypothetical protein
VQVHSAILFERVEEMYLRVYRQWKPRTAPPAIKVEFAAFANANAFIRLKDGVMEVRLADLLEGAPPPVQEALAHILIAKLYRKVVPESCSRRYRAWLNRPEVRRQMHLVRQARGRKQMDQPSGAHYDLVEMFEQLNQRHFHGLMARPDLGWSKRVSRTMLGHYDPSHNAIVLSRILDRESVPRLAVEYVLFHEMLHLRHPAEHSGHRRCVHTPEFKKAEKEFPGLKEAKLMLKKLS